MAVVGGDSEGGLAGGGAGQGVGVASELEEPSFRFLKFDTQCGLQLTGGFVIGVIALHSSYDHFNIFGRVITIAQQWSIWFIIGALAVVAVDAQLASRSRLRAVNEAAQARDPAAEARQRQAEGAEFQRQGITIPFGAALLSARIQLDPSELNRARLSAFLTLLAEQAFLDQQGPES